MGVDEDHQGLALAIIAAKEAEDVKKEQDAQSALEDSSKGSTEMKKEDAPQATGSRPPPGMEPATPTLEADRRSSTTASSTTKPTPSASSSSKSLNTGTGHNP